MKKSVFFCLFLGLLSVTVSAQQLHLATDLDTTINETSGLLYINNTLITHNDSANTNELFEINTTNGTISRTVTITNATNVDWEDLAHDGTYIYIGDFGNFRGDRTDLKVYKVLMSDYFANTNVTAEVISFNYNNQTDFTPSPLATNFDAEGLIHYNNSLYIFSKNWINGHTDIYELPKNPGNFSIVQIDSIVAQGLISGATFNVNNNTILLTGYDLGGAFVMELSGFNSGLFSNGTVTKTAVGVPSNFSSQIEAVAPMDSETYFISAEENQPNAAALYSLNSSTLSTTSTNLVFDIDFYPNPASEKIILNSNNITSEIINITGQIIKTSQTRTIDVSDIEKGMYLIKMEVKNTGITFIKKLIIN